MAFKDAVGRTGMKLSALKAKGKPESPFSKKKGSGEFPSMEDTNFFDPKSLNMRSGRGSSFRGEKKPRWRWRSTQSLARTGRSRTRSPFA